MAIRGTGCRTCSAFSPWSTALGGVIRNGLSAAQPGACAPGRHSLAGARTAVALGTGVAVVEPGSRMAELRLRPRVLVDAVGASAAVGVFLGPSWRTRVWRWLRSRLGGRGRQAGREAEPACTMGVTSPLWRGRVARQHAKAPHSIPKHRPRRDCLVRWVRSGLGGGLRGRRGCGLPSLRRWRAPPLRCEGGGPLR